MERARDIAERLLAQELPRRWAHTRGVARQARRLAHQLGDDAGLVEAAAWLHDIGYASPVAITGFHPLDGARYLRDVEGAGDVLCLLVANHTGAACEAEERGLEAELRGEFGLATRFAPLVEALTACDLAVGPDGVSVKVENRIAEILQRYPADDVVHRAVSRSGPGLIETAHRVFSGLSV